jgi:hypothetical protein
MYAFLRGILFGMKYVAFSSLYLVTLFAISRYLFEPMYLYYELPWLDIPMHVLGGFGVASLAIALLLLRKKTYYRATGARVIFYYCNCVGALRILT